MDSRSHLLLDMYHCASDASAADLNAYLLKRLHAVIGFDSAAIADLAYLPSTGFSITGLYLKDSPLEKLRTRCEVIGGETIDAHGRLESRDLVLSRAYAQRGRSVYADLAELPFQPDVKDYLRRYDTKHSLAFISPATSSPTAASIALWRSTRKGAFDSVHANEADQLLPHLLQARQINHRLAVAKLSGAASTSIALTSFEGCVEFVEPNAVLMLQEEWRQWGPPMLPLALMTALGQGNTFVGSAIQVRAARHGNMLALHIAVRPRLPAALTAAEQRVAKLAAQDMQYKEIARSLGVSPATVRNQLHAVYRKLGVADRRGLVRMWSAVGQSGQGEAGEGLFSASPLRRCVA